MTIQVYQSVREYRLICFSRMTASLLNLDTDSTSDSPMWTNPSDSKIHIGIKANMLHCKFCLLMIDGITLPIK